MRKKMLAALIGLAVLCAGCGKGESDMDGTGVPGAFVSVRCGESGGMERTSSRSFWLRRGEDGALLLDASLFIGDTEVSLEEIEVDEACADEVTRIAEEYDMLARRGKATKKSSLFALDEKTKSFALCFEGADEVSLEDGYKKSDGFAQGRSEIDLFLYGIGAQLAQQYYDAFFENCAGGWTAPNEGMGDYIAFDCADGDVICSIGGHGEQWKRPAGWIDSFALDAQGVYTLAVCFPAEPADDMGHAWESLRAEYQIIPGNGGAELTVTDTQEGTPVVYYRDAID
ncbi:MAG: hypothetical protein VB092_04960 [Oscillospiraceae bacterium]|nr:hypothetical protein [Oscillospiraceae bacterium]